ncbi:MFS transporter [Haladaptatus sp. W1]|uniref:MFS transporter n=1 Tax=Haladaptatus sp. W1 TaxID=1897478 RepID=UPI000849E18D|nr:MFS transporter [Haladaptatus sp. W1]
MFSVDRRVLALAIARMADSAGNSFLIIVLPLYITSGVITGNSFGLTATAITGIVLSLFGFLNSFTQPFAGYLSDKSERRKVFILLGLGILAVTNFSFSLASSYPALVAIRAVQGIGVAFTIPCTIALVNDLASDENRGGNMGVFNTFRLLGFGAGPIAAGALVHNGPYTVAGIHMTGFESAFYIASLGALISFALVTLLVSDPEQADAEAADDFSITILGSRGGLDPIFTLALASLFMAISIALISTLETTINRRLGQNELWFGIEFAAFVLAQVALQTPIGRATDRYGRKQFIVTGLVLLIPATMVQGFVGTPVEMLIARLVQGVAGALVFAPALALAGDIARKGQSGTQLSLLTMAFGLGTAIGPLSSGFLVKFGFQVPFEVGGVLAALGALLVYTQVEETVTKPPDARPTPQD